MQMPKKKAVKKLFPQKKKPLHPKAPKHGQARVAPAKPERPMPSRNQNTKPRFDSRPANAPASNMNKRPPLKAVKRTAPASRVPQTQSKMTNKQAQAQRKQQGKEQINAKLRTQTPANRQNVRTVKKISGSQKNLEIKRRQSTKKQKFYVKKKNKGMRRLFIIGFIIFALVFSLLFGTIAGFVALRLHAGRAPRSEAYYLQIGEKPEDDFSNVTELSKDVTTRNGKLYIPVMSLFDLCSLTVAGTNDDLRYTVRTSEGQSMRFIVDTNIAYVNDVAVRMDSPSFINNGKLHIPIDFLSEYSEGLVIDIDEDENYITIFRTVVGKDEKREDIYADFRFRLGKPVPLFVTAEDSDYSISENE